MMSRGRRVHGCQVCPGTVAGSARGGLQTLAHFLDHRLFVRELAAGEFGVHQFPVDGQFEAAAAGRLQFEALQLLFEFREDLARQTDGTRLVVSGGAVTQVDLHGCPTPEG